MAVKIKNADGSWSVVAGTGGITSVSFANITGYPSDNTNLNNALNSKVDKIEGKGLSTNDLTDTLKLNYDAAYSAKHTHDNKNVIDGITADLISAWNGKSTVSVSATGSTTNVIKYITVNGAEYKLPEGGSGSGASWGQITGTLSDQTDLNTVLGEKELLANKISEWDDETAPDYEAKSLAHFPSEKLVRASLANKSFVSVSNTGSSTNTVKYITVNDTEYKLPEGGSGSGASWGQITGTLSNQTDLNTALNTKLAKAIPTTEQGNKEYFYTFAGENQYTNRALINDLSEETSSYTDEMVPTALSVSTELANKVSKVEGKDLSTNDFTDALKTKLEGLENAKLTESITTTVKVGNIEAGTTLEEGLTFTQLMTLLFTSTPLYPTVTLTGVPETMAAGTSFTASAAVTKGSKSLNLQFLVNGDVVETKQDVETKTYTHTFTIPGDNDVETSGTKRYFGEWNDYFKYTVKAMVTDTEEYSASDQSVVSVTGSPQLWHINYSDDETSKNATYTYLASNWCRPVYKYPASYGDLTSILDPNMPLGNMIDSFTKSSQTIAGVVYNVYTLTESVGLTSGQTLQFS